MKPETVTNTLMQNADEQKRIAEWENKAADSYTYTAKERLGFLQQANDAQERIAQRNMELAEMEYKVQENLTRMAGNKKEENDKLAQTYANMVQAETAYYQTDAFMKCMKIAFGETY